MSLHNHSPHDFLAFGFRFGGLDKITLVDVCTPSRLEEFVLDVLQTANGLGVDPSIDAAFLRQVEALEVRPTVLLEGSRRDRFYASVQDLFKKPFEDFRHVMADSKCYFGAIILNFDSEQIEGYTGLRRQKGCGPYAHLVPTHAGYYPLELDCVAAMPCSLEGPLLGDLAAAQERHRRAWASN